MLPFTCFTSSGPWRPRAAEIMSNTSAVELMPFCGPDVCSGSAPLLSSGSVATWDMTTPMEDCGR